MTRVRLPFASRCTTTPVQADHSVVERTSNRLQRTFITTLLDEGNDIAVASRMAGHRNIATTTRYDRRDERTNQDAAATIHIPYQAPRDGEIPQMRSGPEAPPSNTTGNHPSNEHVTSSSSPTPIRAGSS